MSTSARFENDNGRLGAHYQLDEPLKEARVDLPLLQWIRVRNTGLVPWTCRGAYPINLGYHWLDANGQVVEFEGVRTALPADLLPGEDVRLEIHAEPPPRPGQYQLVVDMVEEHVGWFSLQGIPPLILPITVVAGPENAPRACIIGALCPINDAVGNTMLNQLRFFQKRGYQALILIEHIDPRQPQALRQHMIRMSHGELESHHSNTYNKRALAFFRSAEIYIFHFPLPYVLFEAITLVEHGVAIVDYHGVTPPKLWDGQGHESFYAAVRRQMQMMRYADYAIAHSTFTRQDLLDVGVIAPERIFINSLSVQIDQFRPGPPSAALRVRYGLEEDQPVLLYVGRIATNKRIEDLVRALVLVRTQIPCAVLLLVGDNAATAYAPVAARVLQLAKSLGVADAVIFAGLIPDEELAAHYQLADLFVTASVHEGFGNPVIEAMACGIPVVGAHAAALPETIGDAGLTFRPEDPTDLAEKVLAILGARNQERRTKNEEPGAE